jgi:hypothetical protein
MRFWMILALLAITTLPLSGCYTLAVGAAGAGTGYVIKDNQDAKKGR